jgi:hypothetical protein
MSTTLAFFTAAFMAASATAQTTRVDASTLAGKVVVGYQGWFRCPGDGSPANAWSHWSRGGAPSAATITIDASPDTSGLPAASRCIVPGMTTQGQPAYLFSSFPRETAQTHFRWMREYGIDGALLQRFIADLPWLRSENDVVVQNLRHAAEDNGRTFAIEYDFSMNYAGVSDDQLMARVQADWRHLVDELQLTASASYQRHAGKPLVSLWGLGWGDDHHIASPALAQRLINWFKSQGLTVMGGVPAGWRAGGMSSSPVPGWQAVYASLDIVQPWTVGSYIDAAGADRWKTNLLVPDLAQARTNQQMYLPVIFPGFSWHNLNRDAPQNQIPRDAGRFLWRQSFNAKAAGAQSVKIAMFDEVNESTSIFKVAAKRSQAPEQGYWLTLDADGASLPSDWYLRLAYEIGRVYAGQAANVATIPSNPGPGAAPSGCGIVVANRSFAIGIPVNSCDGRFQLVMQADGNLVLYQGTKALWSSGTAGHPSSRGAMQADGNLVVYDKSGAALWASRTSGNPGARLAIQNDGNLVIYSAAGKTIWASGTCCR